MRKVVTTAIEIAVWAWVLWTLYVVARYGGAVLVDGSTTSRIMAVRSAGQIDSAIGLTYTGIGGALLVLVELVLVGASLYLSRSPRDPLRRAALLVIVAWTLLWLGNSLWLAPLSGGGQIARVGLAALATLVVLLRTVLRWNTDGRPAGPAEAR